MKPMLMRAKIEVAARVRRESIIDVALPLRELLSQGVPPYVAVSRTLTLVEDGMKILILETLERDNTAGQFSAEIMQTVQDTNPDLAAMFAEADAFYQADPAAAQLLAKSSPAGQTMKPESLN